jgi:hypothetical protein
MAGDSAIVGVVMEDCQAVMRCGSGNDEGHC